MAFRQYVALNCRNQFTSDPSQHFSFTAADQVERHAVIRKTSIQVKSNHRHMVNFRKIVNSTDIEQRLDYACLNPKLKTSKQLMNSIINSVKITGSSLAFSPSEQAASLSKMYGLVHMFSWPTYFLTIAPDDLNSTLLIQLALRGRPTQIADYLNPNNSACG